MLNSLPLPGVPDDEKERRRAWTKVPKRVRAAIRRIHEQFGHVPTTVLVALVKAAKLPTEYQEAAKCYKCTPCTLHKPPAQTHKVSLPKPYVFNHTVGIDVFDLHDSQGRSHLFLNIICYFFLLPMRGIGGQNAPPRCLGSLYNITKTHI